MRSTIEISRRELPGAEGITEDITEKTNKQKTLVPIWAVTGKGAGRNEMAEVDGGRWSPSLGHTGKDW